MFERFTDRARNTVVLAQNEARGLGHNYVGTEHILLGLLGEPDSVAGRVLARYDLTLERARDEVRRRVPTPSGATVPAGHIPFTPRAKKILELALREALTLGHNYIGTEHILLGLVRVPDGVGAQVVAARAPDADVAKVRAAVIEVLPSVAQKRRRFWGRPRERASEPVMKFDLDMTPAAEATLGEAARLAGPSPVGSQHLLLAALDDPDSAASRSLTALGVDLDQAKEALRSVDVAGTSDESPEEAGRRQLRIQVTDDRLVIDTTDPTLIRLGHEALDALGDQAREPGHIPGDLPASSSLGVVWQSLHDSLEDIRRRAAEPRDPAA